MFVLLDADDEGNVIEGDDTEAEVRVIRDLCGFGEEGVEVGGFDAVDREDEVGWHEGVLVGRGAASAGRDVDA